MVKRIIIWSYQAKQDLIAILDFFYQRYGTKSYSNKLNLSIRKSVRLLGRHAELGIRTDVPNVRSFIYRDYYIFYKINPEAVEISTIWDNRQDPDKLRLNR